MKHHCPRIINTFIAIFVLLTSVHVHATEFSDLAWQFGPTDVQIGDKAEIHVPDGYVFLGSEDTKELMMLMENIPGEEEYVFAPKDFSWYSVFEFNSVGYIKDNETLDDDALLDSVTRGTEEGNIERKKRGWDTMTILGWKFSPRYEKESNLLEWAFLAKTDNDNSQIINYNTRLLGRTGVMQVVLVADPEVLDKSVQELKQSLSRYDFVSGEKYSEYREGDRVAEFGLAALIAGGVAAVASNKGVWATIVAFFIAAKKIIIVAIMGGFVWLISLFRRKD